MAKKTDNGKSSTIKVSVKTDSGLKIQIDGRIDLDQYNSIRKILKV